MNRKDLYPLAAKGELGWLLYKVISRSTLHLKHVGSDEYITRRRYKKLYGVYPNLETPQTLNEKILWLKLFNHQDFHTIVADKYAVREWLSERFGDKYLIPLLFETDDWRNITIDNLPNEPFVIKANHTSGDYIIVRDKNKLDIKRLRATCRAWLDHDFYKFSQEWQYKNIKRRIIAEKMLMTKDGHIPNDYKLHYINGELQFVYCSVGRETVNKRNIYDADWQPLYFSWVEAWKDANNIRGAEIPAPDSFAEMKRLGGEIAKLFPYVRVDFYDVDGQLYFGEITLHHGGGFDKFVPAEYDRIYGDKLTLPDTKKI